MASYNLLIDTNIFIGLEDARLIDIGFAEFQRRCSKHKVGIFIHEAALSDIERDENSERRGISLSKARKFEKISGIRLPPRPQLEAQYGPIRKANDEVDVALLVALERGVVDFLVTQDRGIHDRVKSSPLEKRVFRLSDALVWLDQTFEPRNVILPFVTERKCHEIDIGDDIFDSLREGYVDFDGWWSKCVRQHRDCWVIELNKELAGICVRKDEIRAEATVSLVGDKILKLCTFKIKPEFRGEKLGELLLKQALWFAQKNKYEIVYLTTKPEQTFLIEILEFFGFQHTQTLADDERVYEKALLNSPLAFREGVDPFLLDRLNYPRFVSGAPITAYFVPIQGSYHHKLFPEIALHNPLPLFPGQMNAQAHGGDPRTPGNTIRKVYLCRSPMSGMSPGDILLFYESKTAGFSASQSVTSVGVLEAVTATDNLDELTRLTAKRSVFSAEELRAMLQEKATPLKVLDFLLVGHLERPLPLDNLVALKVLKNAPQSISKLTAAKWQVLKPQIDLGFSI